ncbi:MAG TPA: aldose 1-epimerase [Candidatus Acidoferrales bacterium]|nr:aldose 1-epimerase [Candidatus Acidoferrales bacterium]
MKRRLIVFGAVLIVTAFVGSHSLPAQQSSSGSQSQTTTQPPSPPSQTTTAPAAATGTFQQSEGPVSIGGEPAVTLTRPRSLDAKKPQFLQAVVLPGAGMNLFQLKAYIPGKGDVDLISTADLATAATLLQTGDQPGNAGNAALAMGAPFLVPFAGVIRGRPSPDGKTISTIIDTHRLSLPANWHGAEPAAVNGLILASKFQVVSQRNDANQSTIFAKLHAGSFNGQWPSETDVTVGLTLKDASLDLYVIAKNVGGQEDPLGIGLLPYFAIPSGDRKQARLTIPADMRTVVNSHLDDFPTGRIVSVNGTAYDFTSSAGTALGNFSIDDYFTDLQHGDDQDKIGGSNNMNEIVQLIDPAAKYGLRMRILSQHIKTIQVYAPADKDFIAIGPQFNLPDPYSRIWRGQDTGMVALQPGKSVVWYVRLELFTPR